VADVRARRERKMDGNFMMIVRQRPGGTQVRVNVVVVLEA
jgi:hypothetical protein